MAVVNNIVLITMDDRSAIAPSAIDLLMIGHRAKVQLIIAIFIIITYSKQLESVTDCVSSDSNIVLFGEGDIDCDE